MIACSLYQGWLWNFYLIAVCFWSLVSLIPSLSGKDLLVKPITKSYTRSWSVHLPGKYQVSTAVNCVAGLWQSIVVSLLHKYFVAKFSILLQRILLKTRVDHVHCAIVQQRACLFLLSSLITQKCSVCSCAELSVPAVTDNKVSPGLSYESRLQSHSKSVLALILICILTCSY